MAHKSIARLLVKPGSIVNLKRRVADDTLGWEKEAAKQELVDVISQIDALQVKLAAAHSRSLLVVLQTMDAGGKDSTIRNVFGPLNAIGVRVNGFKAPAGDELDHDYLWRVHAVAPGRGEIGVWNRSHYEDVLVVRVKGFAAKLVWEKRYRHIREFERMLTDEGTAIVKIHLQISNEEQRVRLQERIDDPAKRWKFRVGDLDDRKLWPDFMKAYEVAFNETSTDYAPWWIVPSERKWVRNLAVARIVLDALQEINPQLPPDDPEIAGLTIE
ncbi:MAG: PPK2 family polyphosphate kinase [Ilumatobacteraceae bacterium]